MMNSITYYNPNNEPLFMVTLDRSQALPRYLVTFPPFHGKPTEYSPEGIRYLMETAYSLANG
jgi:hypothetical protein